MLGSPKKGQNINALPVPITLFHCVLGRAQLNRFQMAFPVQSVQRIPKPHPVIPADGIEAARPRPEGGGAGRDARGSAAPCGPRRELRSGSPPGHGRARLRSSGTGVERSEGWGRQAVRNCKLPARLRGYRITESQNRSGWEEP